MKTIIEVRRVALVSALLVTGVPLGAQSLAARVAAVKEGRVQFTYTPREGMCGDGQTFVRMGTHTYVGSWNGNDRYERECAPGPARVVARVRDGVVDEIRHYVGRVPTTPEGVTDLGTVAAPEAAKWLLDIARRSPARAATKAVFPAVMVDSVVIWRDLLAIARDSATRSRDTRREAAMWLGNFASAAIAGRPAGELDFDTGVGATGDDGSDESEVKKSAVFALSQLQGNAGVPQLVTVARTNKDPEVRRSAIFWLGQSGDARGLALFEEVLSKQQ